MGDDPQYLVVGHVSKAHGTAGEIQIWLLTDRPDEVFAPGARVLLGDREGGVGRVPDERKVEARRPYKGGLLVMLEGVGDRGEAEAIAGRYLLVPAEEASPLEEGEVFYHQLLGLQVETVAGEAVGRIREVFETEPHHLLEVKDGNRVHLVPFASWVVKDVDLEHGRVVIDPPEGLLDL